MGIKVQRTRCFLDIGISNVLGKEKSSAYYLLIDTFTQMSVYFEIIGKGNADSATRKLLLVIPYFSVFPNVLESLFNVMEDTAALN